MIVEALRVAIETTERRRRLAPANTDELLRVTPMADDDHIAQLLKGPAAWNACDPAWKNDPLIGRKAITEDLKRDVRFLGPCGISLEARWRRVRQALASHPVQLAQAT